MKSSDAAAVVQRQLDAYNAKDMEGWLAMYSVQAEQFLLHGERIAYGHDELRERMRLRFAEPDLHAQLVSRMVMGHVVVDLEHITRNLPDGKGVVEMVCVYEVVDGLIVKASFALGTPSLKR